jgi:hypothetical protein
MADRGAVDSLLHPPPEGPRSGLRGHRKEAPVRKVQLCSSCARGLPYLWFIDPMWDGDDDDDEEYNGHYRISIADIMEFWQMTHSGIMGVDELSPGTEDDAILATVM